MQVTRVLLGDNFDKRVLLCERWVVSIISCICSPCPQIDPGKYKSIGGGFKLIMAEQGAKGLYKGWGPTLVGYSLQGACKFGLYEYFKKFYGDLAGEPFATDYKTVVYLAGSASAEFIADIALCPFEAVKVRVQTKPGYAKGLTDGMSKFVAAEGFGG